jgi:serine/threonine protein kinase
VVDNGEIPEAGPTFAGWIWVAFEYVDGKDLSYMMGLKPPEPKKLFVTISALAGGLEGVHAKKLTHRDVKPANVVLRSRKWDAPVLVDFGAVRAANASKLTRTLESFGSPGYMAPELSDRQVKATSASDQWSFARLTAELLLWSKGVDVDEFRVSRDLVADIVDACDDWAALAGVFETALDKDPDLRYESVVEFATAVEEAMYEDGLLECESAEAQFDGEHWDKRRPLRTYVESLGFATVDKRESGGSLWVITSEESFEAVRDYLLTRGVSFQFTSSGGRASRNQPAWYTKSSG